MSKVKSKRGKQDQEMDTSDDDYIDPEMDKYFNKKKEGGKLAAENPNNKNGHGKSHLWKKDDDDDEDEDEDEDEEDETSDDDDEMQLDEMNLNEGDESKEDDGRVKLTLKMIKTWQTQLSVNLYLKLTI